MSKRKPREIPIFEQAIIETHCHLDYLDHDELNTELALARDVGIERIITIAVSPDNLRTVRQIAESKENVFCTQGVHPHEAEKYEQSVHAEIQAQISHPRVVAVGEIGLDYFYDHADRQVQRDVFAKQLQIAVDAELPVVIHSRDADEDMQAILAEFMPSLKSKGVIHSFSSGMELAEYAIDSGFYLGFNGMVTFNKAENVRSAAAATPIEQLILETDSPYLTPVPYRGQTNAPRFLPFVAEKIAELKELPIEALLSQCFTNSETLFFNQMAPNR